MEKILGRKLHKNEFVHHKNSIKTDNRASNLELWTKSHPVGSRVVDKLDWANEFILIYADKNNIINGILSFGV